MNVEIYNRWGERVYSWDGENKSWDGNGVDGQPLSEGVYFLCPASYWSGWLLL